MSSTESMCEPCTVGQAARQGNVDALKRLIQEGHPVNASDNRGWKPTHEAACGNHVECLKILLQQETTDIQWLSYEDCTALLVASQQGSLDAMKLLLDNGADPNVPDSMDEYPLLAAVKSKKVECVKLLLEFNANINCQLYCGTTPLHQAASEGLADIVEVLLEAGARLDICEEYQITPVFSAAQYGQVACLELLLNKAKATNQERVVNNPADDGATPLFLAAQEGHTDCLQMLLECVQQCVKKLLPQTNRGRLLLCDASPFYQSMMHEDGRCTQCILDGGIGANRAHPMPGGEVFEPEVFRYVHSAMYFSSSVSPLALVGLYDYSLQNALFLLDAGARLNVPEMEVAPLLAALDSCYLDLAKLLINRGASLNIYHPDLCGNMVVLLCLHYWKGLNLVLRAGAEVKSLFFPPEQPPPYHSEPSSGEDSPWPSSREHSPGPSNHEHSPGPSSCEHSPGPSNHEHSPGPSNHEHSPGPSSHEHSLGPSSCEHSPGPSSHEHSLGPSSCEHSPGPSSREHSLGPSSCEHSLRPSSREHSPGPSNHEHSPEPSSREHSPEPSSREPSPGPSSREYSPGRSSCEHSPEPSGREPSPGPSNHEHSPGPSNHEHSPGPSSCEHSPGPSNHEHSPEPSSCEFSPGPSNHEQNPGPPSREHSPRLSSHEHSPGPSSHGHTPEPFQYNEPSPERSSGVHTPDQSSPGYSIDSPMCLSNESSPEGSIQEPCQKRLRRERSPERSSCEHSPEQSSREHSQERFSRFSRERRSDGSSHEHSPELRGSQPQHTPAAHCSNSGAGHGSPTPGKYVPSNPDYVPSTPNTSACVGTCAVHDPQPSCSNMGQVVDMLSTALVPLIASTSKLRNTTMELNATTRKLAKQMKKSTKMFKKSAKRLRKTTKRMMKNMRKLNQAWQPPQLDFHRALAGARYVLPHGETPYHVLHRILQFTGNVPLNPELANLMGSQEEWMSIVNLAENPRSLAHYARLAVRQRLHPSQLLSDSQLTAETLEVPQTVLDYIMYRDLDP